MHKEKPWMRYITEENLPNEDLKILASFIGLEKTKMLMDELSGITISIPTNCTKSAKIAYVLDNYDGTKKSRLTLSKECNLSESYIYKTVRNRLQK